jgi:hypothetical protein
MLEFTVFFESGLIKFDLLNLIKKDCQRRPLLHLRNVFLFIGTLTQNIFLVMHLVKLSGLLYRRRRVRRAADARRDPDGHHEDELADGARKGGGVRHQLRPPGRRLGGQMVYFHT